MTEIPEVLSMSARRLKMIISRSRMFHLRRRAAVG
jgi:hypothetical protein